MKITIEAENEDEKKQMETKVYENVFEFAIIGRHIREKIHEDTFSHLHVADVCVLKGKLHELLARLCDGSNRR